MLAAAEDPIRISFPVDKSTILPAFRANRAALARLDSLIRRDSYSPADTIVIIGRASMEGAEQYNLDLARRRAEAMLKYIGQHYPDFPGVLTVRIEGEPWDALRRIVVDDAELPADIHDRMLAIIDSDDPADRKEARLKSLSGWGALSRRLYPDFRATSIAFPYRVSPPLLLDEIEVPDSDLLFPDVLIEMRPDVLRIPALTRRRSVRPVLALSTNLLYDIAYVPRYGLTSIPSVSLEYYPRSYGRFSFGADVEWPMWRHWDEHRFFQIQNVTLNVRWYFGRSYRHDFRGPYALANVNGVRYGIGFNAVDGWEGEGIGAAAGIGYKHSLFGSRRLFWDTGVALGFLYSRYDPYVWGDDPTNRYYYDYNGLPDDFIKRNHALERFGPMRVWFSVGVDLFNRKKPGR